MYDSRTDRASFRDEKPWKSHTKDYGTRVNHFTKRETKRAIRRVSIDAEIMPRFATSMGKRFIVPCCFSHGVYVRGVN